MDDLDTLGGRLKWLREKRLGHRSARETERFLRDLPKADQPSETSYQTIQRYEEDDREPGVRFVHVMARLGGVRFGWLALGEGPRDAIDEDDVQVVFGEVRRLVVNPAAAAAELRARTSPAPEGVALPAVTSLGKGTETPPLDREGTGG